MWAAGVGCQQPARMANRAAPGGRAHNHAMHRPALEGAAASPRNPRRWTRSGPRTAAVCRQAQNPGGGCREGGSGREGVTAVRGKVRAVGDQQSRLAALRPCNWSCPPEARSTCPGPVSANSPEPCAPASNVGDPAPPHQHGLQGGVHRRRRGGAAQKLALQLPLQLLVADRLEL